VAVLHRAHTSGFCSALQQLSQSEALLQLLLSLSPAASSSFFCHQDVGHPTSWW